MNPKQFITGSSFTPRPAAGLRERPIHASRQAARAYYNELASKFPLAGTAAASFTSVTIDAGLVVPAGEVAWYSLINFDPWEKLGQDIMCFGIWFDSLSCNPTPTNAGTEAAWGDEYGLGAAVVVGGQNIPVRAAGTWTSGPCPIAGVDANAAAAVVNSINQKTFSRSFPTGKYTTGFNKRGLNGAIVPYVRRIVKGDSLRAGFALNRSQANAGVNKAVLGFVDLEVYFGYTRNPYDLER